MNVTQHNGAGDGGVYGQVEDTSSSHAGAVGIDERGAGTNLQVMPVPSPRDEVPASLLDYITDSDSRWHARGEENDDTLESVSSYSSRTSETVNGSSVLSHDTIESDSFHVSPDFDLKRPNLSRHKTATNINLVDGAVITKTKIRILALHGAKSNRHVTALQLANLRVIDESSNHQAHHIADNDVHSEMMRLSNSVGGGGADIELEIVHLRGLIEVEDGDEALTAMGVHGPFFSWLDSKELSAEEAPQASMRNINDKLGKSVIKSVRKVVDAVKEQGPFDGIYGFSSGAIVATLAMNIMSDPSLSSAVSKQQEQDGYSNDFDNGGSRFLTSMRHFTSRRLENVGLSTRNFARSVRSLTSRRNLGVNGSGEVSRRDFGGGGRKQPSKRNVFGGGRASRNLHLGGLDDNSVSDQDEAQVDEEDLSGEQEPPFKFAILACSAAPVSMERLRSAARILPRMPPCNIPTFHVIGVKDSHREQSEEIAQRFSSSTREVWYLPGGHGIGREQRSDSELCVALEKFLKYRGRGVDFPNPPEQPEYKDVSRASAIATYRGKQLVQVKVNLDEESEVKRKRHKNVTRAFIHDLNLKGKTIISMLERHPPHDPFLRVARSDNLTAFTSYGDVLKFIAHEGNLCENGVKHGEVVAYGAPDGGGAVSALAFLAIAAQTTAAPLAPNTTEPDAMQALEQFNAKHLILFENLENDGTTSPTYGVSLRAAFEAYAEKWSVPLHIAKIIGDDHPGMFRFDFKESSSSVDAGWDDAERLLRTDDSAPSGSVRFNSLPPRRRPRRRLALRGSLTNPYNGVALLLRTSGTTSKPKVVPLKQGQLLANGEIIAASMGLLSEDVCYSVMPLYHIGGISASILCSLASGSSVCCDNKPFAADQMVDALALSRPQPTWYSSVPTIHNSTVAYISGVMANTEQGQRYGIGLDGVWKEGHSLRMIRSGAAALLGPDGDALSTTYGGVPVYPTYSMSEQMPISQPPAGKGDTLQTKPGSVGVPVAASVAIVNSSTLRLQPAGIEGEIAISGPTVMNEYQDNQEANSKSFFYLTLPGGTTSERKYFLTGDVGTIDKDGFLFLKGRSKELIKKGGEQISPFEVEEILQYHRWVKTAVCFSVPSQLYGEEVGCAIVLSSMADAGIKQREVEVELRSLLRERKLAPVKFPTKWILVNSSQDIPQTKTKKFIRIGLSTALGLDPKITEVCPMKDAVKAKMDWQVLSGLRFFLACYVMFMHIGSNESFGGVSNLRGFPWHVHLFFTLGGYSMAAPMAPKIEKKFAYFKARIRSMLPMYYVALVLGLINLIVVCNPSTFEAGFTWDSQKDDSTRDDLFCEGTPIFKKSYFGSLAFTILIYALGLQVTPFWPLIWWVGYYLWFSAMYYQCLAFFPVLYNRMYELKKKSNWLLKVVGLLFFLNAVILMGTWLPMRNFVENENSDLDGVSLDNVEDRNNYLALGLYLFGPFWVVYFAIGVCTAFLYDFYRPAEHHNKRKWGLVADSITMLILAISIALIAEGPMNESNGNKWRPQQANDYTDDNAQTNRLWDSLVARMFAPVTTLWVFALSTGEGVTAKLFRSRFLVETLSPTSYHCFLFHQIISQWYFVATRGLWWYWWGARKEFYWFSPKPCPVEWYEYPYLVILTVCWAKLMVAVEQLVDKGMEMISELVSSKDDDDDTPTAEVLCKGIEDLTGIGPQLLWTLEECGLGSIGLPVLVQMLNKAFAKQKGTHRLQITASKLIEARTIQDMVQVVDEAKAALDADGV